MISDGNDLFKFNEANRNTENHEIGLYQKICEKCHNIIRSFGVKLPATVEIQPNDEQSQLEISAYSENSFEIDIDENREFSTIDVISAPATHARCFVCKSTDQLIVVPAKTRVLTYSAHRYYIPKGNRICPDHLINNSHFENDLQMILHRSKVSEVPTDEFLWLVEQLRIECVKTLFDEFGDFSVDDGTLFDFTRGFEGKYWRTSVYRSRYAMK